VDDASASQAAPDSGQETIAAIATPPGTGGIGIVRVSGPRALELLRRFFRPRRKRALRSHRLTYGRFFGADGRLLDEVLAVYMAAPHTYTREDVVEIHAHGSYAVVQAILTELIGAGARLAQPGEFTRRAFLAGRIDLTQAEAVVDLINARTARAARMAAAQLDGRLQERFERVRQALLEMAAILEVAIDFPEEEDEILDGEAMRRRLDEEVRAPLDELLRLSGAGRLFREGAVVVLAGRPNVGKSSLLNVLLRQERALVTPEAGTTRDTVEEMAAIAGMPVRLVDTAGLRETPEGAVEALGIDQRDGMIDGGLLEDAVAQVKNVSRSAGGLSQHVGRSAADFRLVGQQDGGFEIALDGTVFAHDPPRFVQPDSPVHAHYGTACLGQKR